MSIYRWLDLPGRALRRLRGDRRDYRIYLFEHLQARLGGRPLGRVLEVGPRDGVDTERLATLGAERLILADLPHARDVLEAALAKRGVLDKVELRYGNIMYDDVLADLVPFDLIWCTGVLYHNPEQLRMIVRLFDWLAPDGLLVLETATARRAATRNQPCVEIWHNVPKAVHQANHVSSNVTHLPSRSAIAAWLEMAGFAEIEHSPCHRQQSFNLNRNRAAFIARRPQTIAEGAYYLHTEENYPLGRAL
jgi:2-polyprenyl-3-methyl-5-hydroxy-6-metoxy-1,4-benzoquinol methylase